MQVDALAVRMRLRTSWEAADLGTRLCQTFARPIYRCYFAVALPAVALCLLTYPLAGWLPSFALWWLVPWLDRTIVFVLSRAAFGQTTTFADVWASQRTVWWKHLLSTLTIRRLSPWRSLTQPVYQLEDLPLSEARGRARQIRRGVMRPGFAVTCAFACAETGLMFGLLSLAFWLAPTGHQPDFRFLLSGEQPGLVGLIFPLVYSAIVLFLEPFYVAAGFGMYLNRRASLEAWDVEQELRRAFAT